MVERYLISYDERGEQKHPSGDFVHYDDYARLSSELSACREALEPSAATKAAYIGEFRETITVANPDYDADDDSDDAEPEFIEQRVIVSWTTIKEIMAAISARATLSSAPSIQEAGE